MKVFHDTSVEAARVMRREYGYSIEESVYRRVLYDSENACNFHGRRDLVNPAQCGYCNLIDLPG